MKDTTLLSTDYGSHGRLVAGEVHVNLTTKSGQHYSFSLPTFMVIWELGIVSLKGMGRKEFETQVALGLFSLSMFKGQVHLEPKYTNNIDYYLSAFAQAL